MNVLKKISWLLFCAMILSGCRQKTEEILWEDGQKSGLAGVKESNVCVDTQEEFEYQICVDISGAVMEPGVYLLEEGARVYQAVELAGGLTEEADRDSVNLAAYLKDGEKIRIYTLEEASALQDIQMRSGMVNLNTADVSQLCTLTGIGESRAEDIIAYREQHGSFQCVEEIMNVSGIKDTTFQKIKDKIVVE